MSRSLLRICLMIPILLGGGCDDDIELGLLNRDLCFVTEGGNAANVLRVNSAWSIQIEGVNPFFSISPLSGNGSESLVNLILNAQVNNNPDSRIGQFQIVIGQETLTYNVFQDGTIQKSCIP